MTKGDHVFHPKHGVCRALGERVAVVAGEHLQCLAIAPIGHPTALVFIPLRRIDAAGLRAVTATEAAELQSTWRQPAKPARQLCPRQMALRGYAGAAARWHSRRSA